MYDFSSLYPAMMLGFILCGPGIMYYPHAALAEYRNSVNENLSKSTRKKYKTRAAVIVSDAETAHPRVLLNFNTSNEKNLYEESDDDNDDSASRDPPLGDKHSVDDNPHFRQKFKNVDFQNESGNTKRRYFSYGMFSQRENSSLESIRYLEYLNWDATRKYNGRIQHAYNSNEKKIGKYSVDGYVEWEDEFVPGSGMTGTPFLKLNIFLNFAKSNAKRGD